MTSTTLYEYDIDIPFGTGATPVDWTLNNYTTDYWGAHLTDLIYMSNAYALVNVSPAATLTDYYVLTFRLYLKSSVCPNFADRQIMRLVFKQPSKNVAIQFERFYESGNKWWLRTTNFDESSQSSLNLKDISSLVVEDDRVLGSNVNEFKVIHNQGGGGEIFLFLNGVFIDILPSITFTNPIGTDDILIETIIQTLTNHYCFGVRYLKYEQVSVSGSGMDSISFSESIGLSDGTPTFATDSVKDPKGTISDSFKFKTSKLQARRLE